MGINSSADPQDTRQTPFLSELWDHNQSAETVINIAISGNATGGGVTGYNNAYNAESSMTLFEIVT